MLICMYVRLETSPFKSRLKLSFKIFVLFAAWNMYDCKNLFSWPEPLWSPAGDDPSSVRSLRPVAAHSCTTWPRAQEHHGLRISGWQRSQLAGWPGLTQHLDVASGWAGLMVCTYREGMISVWFIQNWYDSLLNYPRSQLACRKQIFLPRQCFEIWSSVYVAELCRWVTMCLLTINTEENTLLVLACWVGGCAYILPCIFQSRPGQL